MKATNKENTLQLGMEEDITSTNVRQHMEQAREALSNADKSIDRVEMDLSQVKQIDSQGLNFLVGLYQECHRNEMSFRVTGVSSPLKRLFHFVKLHERFGIDAKDA